MEQVTIRHGVLANPGPGGGWLPIVWVGERMQGCTWASSGYDIEAAAEIAEYRARAEAARYVGDWRVTVEPVRA